MLYEAAAAVYRSLPTVRCSIGLPNASPPWQLPTDTLDTARSSIPTISSLVPSEYTFGVIKNPRFTSLGNGVNVREILKRTSAQAIRYLMLSAHYRSPLNFSDEIVRQAENGVGRLATCRDNLKHRLSAVHTNLPHVSSKGDVEVLSRLDALRKDFENRMNDDFSTPDALTVWFQIESEANAYLQRPVVHEAVLQELLNRIAAMDAVLCLLPLKDAAGLPDEEVDALIAERTDARASRNYSRADEIRDLLAKRGILLEDTPQGIRWRRK